MKIENNEIQTIPYSHHFRCFPQMVGSVANQAVFMYLMDEYIYRLKTGKDTSFPVSINEISSKRNMTWRTVANALSKLEVMGLISVVNDICTINVNKYVALVYAFYKLPSTKDKQDFTKFLAEGDFNSLEKMGLEDIEHGEGILVSQQGVLLNSRSIYKTDDDTSAKKQNLCHLAEPKDELTSAKKQNLCQMTEATSAKKQNLLLKSRTMFAKIQEEFRKYFTKNDFIELFGDEILEFCGENELKYMAYAIFDEECVENVNFGPEFGWFLWSGVLSFSRRGFCHLAEGVLSFSRTVNNIYNNNNKLRGSEASLYIGGKQIEEEENFDLNLNNIEQSISSYRNLKKKNSLPFLPVDEVKNYISDIRNCLDRADKIFINQVWEIAHECLDQEAIFDEDGNEQLPANSEIENCGIAKERLRKDILLPAFDKTQEIIEAGSFEIKGELFPVTATLEHPEELENVIDWELQTLLDGENYIVSTKRVRNIFGEQVEHLSPRSAKRSNREDDMGYMQKIIQIGDDDARYSQLTPIELMIYNFLASHFQIGESGEIEEPLYRFVNRTTLGLFYLDVKTLGVSESDFIGVVSNDKPDANGNLNLRQRMFSADKIRNWNKLHSHSSIVDQV